MTGTGWDPKDWGSEGAPDEAASSPELDTAPQDAQAPGPLVPGMIVPSPAMDYVLGRQRRRMRRGAAASAAVVAIVVVAAVLAAVVGHKSGPSKPASAQLTAAQSVALATRQQASVKSESATVTEQISGSVSATISGTVQLQRKPLLLAMNLSETVAGHTARIRGIITSSLMYVKLGTLPGIPGYLGAKWLRIPLTGLGQSSVFATMLQELQNENPASQVALLNGAKHLRAAGSQVVSGVTTTRYNGSITPATAVKSLPAAQRAELAPYLDQIKGSEAVSVWIDGDHNVRKVETTESTAAATITAEGIYGSFNQPVKIVLPRPGQLYTPPASALNA